MGTFLTTASVSEARRGSFWQDMVCDTFVQLDCLPCAEGPFAGEIATTELRELNLSRVRSRAQRVGRTPARIRQANQEVTLLRSSSPARA